jgi:uncharacterized protein
MLMGLSVRRVLSSFLFLLVLFFVGCSSFFFYPQKQEKDNPLAQLLSPEDIYFKTPDGITLHGRLFEASPQPLGTILILHGNAENLSTHVNGVLWLVQEGFNIFIFDYRGYGRSEGEPSLKGVHVDAEEALKTVLNLPQTKGGKVIVLGQSIGGAIGVYTVANFQHKDRVAALVVDSAFSSYRLIAREKLGQFFLTWPLQYPLSLLFNDDYSPLKWIKTVTPVPVLIIHGASDPVVPSHHGFLLYEAALLPKDFWETPVPGHIMAFMDEEVRNKFVRYLRDHLNMP